MSYNSYSNSLGRRPSREHCATSGPGKELPGQRGSGGSQSSRGSTYPGSSFQSGSSHIPVGRSQGWGFCLT